MIAEEFLRQAALGDATGACMFVIPQDGPINPCLDDLGERKDFQRLKALDDAVTVKVTHVDGDSAIVTDADLSPKPAIDAAIRLVKDSEDGLWYVRWINEEEIDHILR